MEVKKVIDKKAEYWKKKLIDLSKRNNLVSYRFTKAKSLQIKEPDFKHVIEDLNHEKNVNILKKENGKAKERLWLCTEEEETVDKVEDVEDFKEISLKEKYENYEVAELPNSRTKIEFDSYGDMVWGGNKAKELMLSVLEVESPIEKELLYKKVLASFGINKLGARLKRNFDDLVNQMKREYSNIYVYEETVSIDKIDSYCPPRISTEKQRPFTLIPKEEIAGAIVDILTNTFSATKETLVADIAREIYHNNRTGSKIKSKIDEAVKHLLKKKVIRQDNNKFILEK